VKQLLPIGPGGGEDCYHGCVVERAAWICVAPLLLVLAGACGRLDYDALQATLDGGGSDAALPSVDAGPALTCAMLGPALETAPADPYLEPSLHVDGLTLVARRTPGPTLFQATRATSSAAFGPFGAVTVVQSDVQDQTFLDIEVLGLGPSVIAMGSTGSGPRSLVLCEDPPAQPCGLVTVFDELGVAITDDIDGPTLAIRDGALVMAFSRGSEIYLATPRATLAEWDAALFDLGVFGLGAVSADDPALTTDGTRLFVPMTVQGVGSLYALRFDGEVQGYTGPERVFDGVGSPAVGIESATAIEVFVQANTRGVSEPHRLSCVP